MTIPEMVRNWPTLAGGLEKNSGYFHSNSGLWTFCILGDPVFRQETGMDMSETSPLFDDIALSGRFSDALGHQTSVQSDHEEGALFEDIHALAAVPEVADITKDRRPSVIGRNGVASALDDPLPSPAAAEEERPSWPNDRPYAVGRPAQSRRPSKGMLPSPMPLKPVFRKEEAASGVVFRAGVPGPRGLHACCRGPPQDRKGPAVILDHARSERPWPPSAPGGC
jgi:hypothetical protein